ncbi:MAG: hypothetical protein NTW48_09350, partial [Chloroflexi bacterium]|nr:hypothetical protein [Chloroflexota bacterium]
GNVAFVFVAIQYFYAVFIVFHLLLGAQVHSSFNLLRSLFVHLACFSIILFNIFVEKVSLERWKETVIFLPSR